MTTTRKASKMTRKTSGKTTRKTANIRYIYYCHSEHKSIRAKNVRESALFILEKAADVKEVVSLFAEGATIVIFRHQLSLTAIVVIVGVLIGLSLVKVKEAHRR